MPRKLWGEFDEPERPVEPEHTTPLAAKRTRLEEMNSAPLVPEDKIVKIKAGNPIVTQTIEVMKQTEMLQGLIDTYSNKSEFTNYLVNPCEVIPKVDFPPENSADFCTNDKFTKPIWFVPPFDTPFARGVPQHYAEVNTEVCRASFRKAICGQLRVAGFTDTTESALTLFTCAIDEFMRGLIREIRLIKSMNPKKDVNSDVDVCTVEKAYYGMTNMSLLQMHNFIKHNLVSRNRKEIAEFKEALNEYDKLMQQSEQMQKDEFKTDMPNEFQISSELTEQQQQQPQTYYEINGTVGNTNTGLVINNVHYTYTPQIQQTQQHHSGE